VRSRLLMNMSKIKANYSQELKTSWFLPLRLAIFLIVVGVIVITGKTQSDIYTPFFAYSILTLLLLVGLAFKLPSRYPRVSQIIIMIHIISEVIVEAVVISVTGDISSPFTALFLLTIVSAAMAFQLPGTLLAATIACFAYGTAIWSSTGERIPETLDMNFLRTVYASNDEYFYTLFLYICIFYLVAFVAGFLSQKIKSKERELKAASESLARVRLETDEILKHLHSGLITIDHFGRIIYFNEAAEKITGFRESKIKGRNCLEVFADRMPEFSEKLLSVLKSSQHEHRSEITITDGDGIITPMGISTSILADDIRGVRGVIGIFQNLTEAKQMEERMRHADKLAAVGELSASIAHEIRNPLASISGSVEILNQELNLDGQNRKLMDLIVKEAGRLSNILNDFLIYARVKPPAFSKVEINRLVSDVIELSKQHPSNDKNIKIMSESDDTTVYTAGDEEQLRQILINLIVNAMDSIGDNGGNIRVYIEGNSTLHSDQVIISVHDDGPGFAPEIREKMFTPFFSTKKEGTGLGLAIVKRLIDNMGGKIWVESSTQGGTRFKFVLIKYYKGMITPNNDVVGNLDNSHYDHITSDVSSV
jgi:two-component system, NtrC family, sensor histidine kinase PilS